MLSNHSPDKQRVDYMETIHSNKSEYARHFSTSGLPEDLVLFKKTTHGEFENKLKVDYTSIYLIIRNKAIS